ncbi:MAG: cytochrome C [Proteobacteria bacterium]|nr:cytochrome C [Pseudomonadota bacterium]
MPVAWIALGALFAGGAAQAVPSFARQTGMPCAQCHTQAFGPGLTAYGRSFKLNAYTFGDQPSLLPLAAMVQGGFDRTATDQPDPPTDHTSTNDNFTLDQLSLFIAGRVAPHVGVFAQVTYDGNGRATSWDNLDVRYARSVTVGTVDAVVGVSINNNPTVQDLWNSTPAWGVPYISSPLNPSPIAAAVVDGGLAQSVLGATAYALIHDHVYLEAGAYRGLSDRWLNNLGVGADASPHLNGAVPYWRAAYQSAIENTHYFSLGAFGLNARLQPDPTVPDTDRFTDLGMDATYQYTDADRFSVSTNVVHIRENQNLGATFNAQGASSPSHHLDEWRLDGTLTFRQTWSATLAAFDTRGSTDPVLYAPGALSGSATGSPDTRGYIVQFEVIPFGKLGSFAQPWVNARLGLQWTGYTRFNGGSSNYDGFARNAHDNNSLFVYYWIAM